MAWRRSASFSVQKISRSSKLPSLHKPICLSINPYVSSEKYIHTKGEARPYIAYIYGVYVCTLPHPIQLSAAILGAPYGLVSGYLGIQIPILHYDTVYLNIIRLTHRCKHMHIIYWAGILCLQRIKKIKFILQIRFTHSVPEYLLVHVR